jgi:hypothetical protein
MASLGRPGDATLQGLVVAAVLAGRADLPADARLAEGLRGEH